VNTIKLVEAGKEYTRTASVSGWGYTTRIRELLFLRCDRFI